MVTWKVSGLAIVLALIATIEVKAAPPQDCKKNAARAAVAIDSISHGTSESKYQVRGTGKMKSSRSGGETLDTYRVHITANEDMAAYYEVELYSSQCLIKSVQSKGGD